MKNSEPNIYLISGLVAMMVLALPIFTLIKNPPILKTSQSTEKAKSIGKTTNRYNEGYSYPKMGSNGGLVTDPISEWHDAVFGD